MGYQEENSKVIDKWVEQGWEWSKPTDHETFLRAKNGDYTISVSPFKPIPNEWFGNLKGKRILGLACGGGQQMPKLVALGGNCTCMDYSQKQLDQEALVSKREGYNINLVKADMTKAFPFENDSFDLILHAVSNCYIEKVDSMYKECFRVLKKGGVLISGFFCNELIFLIDENSKELTNKMPFNPLVNDEYKKQLERQNQGVQFSHTLEEQLGGILKAGFCLKDIFTDKNESGILKDLSAEVYAVVKALK